MTPVRFNLASIVILPVGVLVAATLEDQVDRIYEVADDPNTEKSRARALAALAGKLIRRNFP